MTFDVYCAGIRVSEHDDICSAFDDARQRLRNWRRATRGIPRNHPIRRLGGSYAILKGRVAMGAISSEYGSVAGLKAVVRQNEAGKG
jgi:hypothetical protein